MSPEIPRTPAFRTTITAGSSKGTEETLTSLQNCFWREKVTPKHFSINCPTVDISVSFGPFWKNVLSFWEQRNEPNVLFLKYEDMRADLEKILREVAAFLEKELTQEQIDKLKHHLSFESMKKNRSVNYESLVELNTSAGLTEVEDGAFMRSGSVGGYKAVMSPQLIEEFDRWTAENTQGTGLSLDK